MSEHIDHPHHAELERRGMSCNVEGCERPSKTRGMCGMHAERVRLNGTPGLATKPTPQDRFWAKVNKTETCWLWVGANNGVGYGQLNIGGRMRFAHRLAYQWFVGPIPDGMQLDHLCRVRNCVNPGHLEPVTHRENSLRGMSPGAIAWRTNKCRAGHEFTPENTIHEAAGRRCRTCVRAGQQRRRAERKESAA